MIIAQRVLNHIFYQEQVAKAIVQSQLPIKISKIKPAL